MNYTTVAKVLQTLPAIGSVTSIVSSTIAAFGDDAESLVDAMLSKQYAVPVTGSPPLLAMIATDITIYRLLTRRIFTAEQINKSDWPEKYRESVDLLGKLADGSIALVDSSGTAISMAATSQPWSNTQSYEPTFNEAPMEVQEVDADKLTDLGVRLGVTVVSSAS